MPGRDLLFVYGALMHGGRLHRHLDKAESEFVGEARIRERLYSLPRRYYPAAIPDGRSDSFVHGELYRLRDPAEALRRLDEVEGCDEGLFRRRLVAAWLNGLQVKAWTYLYAKPLEGARLIPTGSHRRWTRPACSKQAAAGSLNG
jgi:gamma-glutamylcyclotransferase (GGCT)/AIG2-like uncharacterized protein YtfP